MAHRHEGAIMAGIFTRSWGGRHRGVASAVRGLDDNLRDETGSALGRADGGVSQSRPAPMLHRSKAAGVFQADHEPRAWSRAHKFWKRVMDLILAGLCLVLTSPLWMLTAAVLRMWSGPPILYRGQRLGRGASVFEMYKFRTMSVGARKSGPGVTGDGDARITPLGKVLRRWKVDELPQLVNVLRGEMSMVGPRPEDPRYLGAYTLRQRCVFGIRPGITGPTQIQYRHEERMLEGPDVERQYLTKLLPAKLELDLGYLGSPSLTTDAKLILMTAASLLGGFVPPVRIGRGE